MWLTNFRKNTRLGAMLVKRGLISTAQLHDAVSSQRGGQHTNLGQILVERGWVSQRDLQRCLRRQARIRYVAALAAVLCGPLQTVSASGFPTASADAEGVAFSEAQQYAESPQLKMHDPNLSTRRGSTSIRYATRLAANMLLRSFWRQMRDDGRSDGQEGASSKATVKTRYSLRLDEDKVVVRAKINF